MTHAIKSIQEIKNQIDDNNYENLGDDEIIFLLAEIEKRDQKLAKAVEALKQMSYRDDLLESYGDFYVKTLRLSNETLKEIGEE